MSIILTIDQSTTSTKVLLIDEHAQILAQSAKKHAQLYPQNGWVEHDAQEIYSNLLEVTKQLRDQYPHLLSQVKGIAISNQRETSVVWNKFTGIPIAPAIVWQCRRTSSLCSQYKPYEERVEVLTGLKIDPYFSATKIRWLLDHAGEQDIEQLAFGTMESWLIYCLSGKTRHVSDMSNASRTLLMNIHTRSWDQELLAIFQIPRCILPEIVANDACFAMSDIEGLLSHAVPICGVIGDSQASLYAQQCFTLGSTKVTMGTGSSILRNAGANCPVAQQGLINTFAWQVHDMNVYAQEAIINASGDTLNWLRDEMKLYQHDDELNKVFTQLSNNEGVYLVPAFVGLSVPWWAPDAKASISGLSRNTDYRHVLRAGLEAIAYQILDALQALGYTPNSILYADGGATHNQALMQFLADISNCSISVSDTSNLSAMGAYAIACEHLHIPISSLSNNQVYHPQMDDITRNKNIQGWHQAIHGVLAQSKYKEEKASDLKR